MDQTLLLANVVATPTDTAWSQTYSAGKLFAALSLSQEEKQETSLASHGKDLMKKLEEEFFTLEEKNLKTIENAVQATVTAAPDEVRLSLVVAAVTDDILYVVIKGMAKAYLRRGKDFGLILKGKDKVLVSTSGFLQPQDTVVLATEEFTDIVTPSTLSHAISHYDPTEAAEVISPRIHEKEIGAAAAIIATYNKPEELTKDQGDESEEEEIRKEAPKETKREIQGDGLQKPLVQLLQAAKEKAFNLLSLLPMPRQKRTIRFSHSSKLFTSLAVIIGIVFVTSIYFSVQKKEQTKTHALFQEVYSKAQKKYDEGISLLSLNKGLAREDLISAKKTLEDAKNSFPKDSEEQKKITALLQKTDDALSGASGTVSTEATTVDPETVPLLSAAKENKGTLAAAEDETTVYLGTKNAVTKIDKKTKKEKSTISKDSLWDTTGGLGVYLGNIYVLDPKGNQIIKFSGGSKDAKSSYFPSDHPSLQNAVSMAIDGSVWVLFSDGSVRKFTRGKEDSFSVKSLDKPLQKPSRIVTDTESSNVYILDVGNGRIVVLSKDGTFQTQYVADVLKKAAEIVVYESEKKAYVLSDNTVFAITLR